MLQSGTIIRWIYSVDAHLYDLAKGLNVDKTANIKHTTMNNTVMYYLFPWKCHTCEGFPLTFWKIRQAGVYLTVCPVEFCPQPPLFHSSAVQASVHKRQISAHEIACYNKTTNNSLLAFLSSFSSHLTYQSSLVLLKVTTRGRQTQKQPRNNPTADHHSSLIVLFILFNKGK